MDTVCSQCGATLDTPYVLIGAAIECPSCGKRTIPEVQVGTRYPDTGCEITFASFQQLLSYAAYRPSIARLLYQWFGYKVEASGDAARILSRGGEEVDQLLLHRSIQEDGPKQSTLYQAAMSLWR